jgi:Crp-like helix-turn-helix domain
MTMAAGKSDGKAERMPLTARRSPNDAAMAAMSKAACCARWLHMTHDRVGADEFPLTQEFLSRMLGVRRATVNSVVRGMQRAGLIDYTRGKITTLNRRGLEAASCMCYQIIGGEHDRLFEQYARDTDAGRR